jgi:threonyl-tRNA synthetase
MSYSSIEKKLAKKNAELVEVRDSRRKLDDKEKEILAAIETLQNQKVEYIFAQVKREMKTEKLDVSSGSILPLLEVLRQNQQIVNLEIISDEVKDSEYANQVESNTEAKLND